MCEYKTTHANINNNVANTRISHNKGYGVRNSQRLVCLTRIIGRLGDDADPLHMLELGGKLSAARPAGPEAQQLLPGEPDDALVPLELGEDPALALGAGGGAPAPGGPWTPGPARSAVGGAAGSPGGGGVGGPDPLGQVGEGAAGSLGRAAAAAATTGGGAEGVGPAGAAREAAAVRGSLVGTAAVAAAGTRRTVVVEEGQGGEVVDAAPAAALGLAAAAHLVPAAGVGGGVGAGPVPGGRGAGGRLLFRGGLGGRRGLEALAAAAGAPPRAQRASCGAHGSIFCIIAVGKKGGAAPLQTLNSKRSVSSGKQVLIHVCRVATRDGRTMDGRKDVSILRDHA